MSKETQKSTFFDSKTLLAIVLVGFAWMGWQWYMNQKYPQYFQAKKEADTAKEASDESGKVIESEEAFVKTETSSVTATVPKTDEIAEKKERKEVLTSYADEYWSFDFSSHGMGIKDLQLKKYLSREHTPVKLGQSEPILPLETNLMGQKGPLYFDVKKVREDKFIGQATIDGMVITKTVVVDSKNYRLKTNISVRDLSPRFDGLVTYLAEKFEPSSNGSFFHPQFERQEFFVVFNGKEERTNITSDNDISGRYRKVKVASLGSQYFTMAIRDESPVMPELDTTVDHIGKKVLAALKHKSLNRQKDFEIEFVGFMGPKSLKLLTSIDDSMAGIIDFGMFSFLAHYILKLMKLFYGVVGNWGVAIILLTLLVRTILLPFNIMSFRSMKSMQLIQPRLKEIREKYKDDRQALNTEMMALMRENKVNPMGGCLPMLLQFPVFIALYQVLGQSIELYQAPFFLWIHDLSLKDPYYVLPVLMGITMFVQQKITPTTMDPAQAKVLMFMPVIFSLFMLALPSGLTLYIFVSALFGIAQQFYFLKEKRQLQEA